METVWKRFDEFEAVIRKEIEEKTDKKVLKLKKEIDIGSVIRQVRLKTDYEEFRREANLLVAQVNAINDLTAKMKVEFDPLKGAITRLGQYVALILTDGTNALVGTKACLACGKGEVNFLPPSSQVRIFIVLERNFV